MSATKSSHVFVRFYVGITLLAAIPIALLMFASGARQSPQTIWDYLKLGGLTLVVGLLISPMSALLAFSFAKIVERVWALVTPPQDHPVCASCGYDLTGNLSGRCPECGLLIGASTRTWSRGEVIVGIMVYAALVLWVVWLFIYHAFPPS